MEPPEITLLYQSPDACTISSGDGDGNMSGDGNGDDNSSGDQDIDRDGDGDGNEDGDSDADSGAVHLIYSAVAIFSLAVMTMLF